MRLPSLRIAQSLRIQMLGFCDILLCAVQSLSGDIQQHLLTIQQLTQQVQALSSLKRSCSTSDQPADGSRESAAVCHATDIHVDTLRLETIGKPQNADSTAERGAVSKLVPIIRTVDPLKDEVHSTSLGLQQSGVSSFGTSTNKVLCVWYYLRVWACRCAAACLPSYGSVLTLLCTSPKAAVKHKEHTAYSHVNAVPLYHILSIRASQFTQCHTHCS